MDRGKCYWDEVMVYQVAAEILCRSSMSARRLRVKLALTTLLALMGGCASAASKDSLMEQITLRDGLSQSTVFSIAQDSTGYMWFGTRNGLNRFDGYQFRHFFSDQGLPSSFIWSVLRDDDALWLGTQGGGLVKRLPSGEFVGYSQNATTQHEGSVSAVSPKVVVDVERSARGGLWLATQDAGLQYFDKQTELFTRHAEGAIDSSWSVLEDSSRNVWIGSAAEGLTKYNAEANNWKTFVHDDNDPTSLSHDSVWHVLEDSGHSIWVATFGGGLNRLDPRSGQFIHYRFDAEDSSSLSNDFVWTVFEDRRGRLWVGTNGGLNLFDRTTETFTRFLLGQEIKSLYEDNAGTLWVGSYYGGIFKLDEKRNKFQLMHHQPENPNSLASDTVNGMWQEDDGTLWVVGDGGGMSRVDGKTQIVKRFQNNPKNENSISNNHPMNIMRMKNGDFLLGNYSGGMNRFDSTSEMFTRFLPDPNNPNSISDDTVFAITEDQKGRVWVGTWKGGLNQYYPETGHFTAYRHDAADPYSIGDDYVQVLLADTQDRLWVGTASAGLHRFFPEENRFQKFQHDPADPSSVSHNHIYALLEREDGKFWVGTEYGGLNLFDPIKGTFEHFMDAQNQLQTAILGIIEDDKGLLWLSSRNGLLRYNPATNFAQNYSEGDGLQSREFISGSRLKGRDGFLYFGGVGGLNYFRPSDVENNPFVPSVVITKLSILHGEQRDILLDQQSSITLSYDDQPFLIDFSALNYTRSELNRYRYKLEGLDRSWLSTEFGHQAVYHRVSPGRYEFKVRGANNDGVWNAVPAKIEIVIKPPWWLSVWAYLLYLLVAAILILLYWRWRHRTLMAERERDVAQRSEQAKQEFLAKMSHEIRTPLSGMLGMSELLEGTALDFTQKHYVKSQISAGNSLLKIINDILEFSKMEANKLELTQKPFSLRRLLDDLTSLFQIETDRRNLTLSLNYPTDVPDKLRGDPVRLRQILSNLLGNAVKFTEEGGVWVDVKVAHIGDRIVDLVIEVKDSGIGIENKKLQEVFGHFYQAETSTQHSYGGTGLGLSISRQLIELMDGRMKLSSQYGVGTTATIEVSLPLASESDEELGETLSIDEYCNRAHVLIVEDNDINALALMHLLTDFGCNVEIVTDGSDALRYLEMNQVDLVFMDRHMPKMDGIEAARQIRSLKKWQHLPIVALTASVSLQDKAQCLSAGMNEYLLKPLLREKAVRVLNKYCHHLQYRKMTEDRD